MNFESCLTQKNILALLNTILSIDTHIADSVSYELVVT